MRRCSQCQRPAFEVIEGHPLCVEHATMVRRSRLDELESLERQHNQAKIDMAWISGSPDLLAVALAEREAMEKKSTNINISNSNVGAINTGTIQSLSVKMTRLQEAGSPEMAQAFQALTSAILASSLPPATQNELASQLEFVAGQAAEPPVRRNTAVVKATLHALSTTLSTTADLLQVWTQWGPVIAAFFGFP
jgi:hypothetical protein